MSSNWGYFIGKIIPKKGFVSNKRYRKELEHSEALLSDSVTDVAYGQYSLLSSLSSDILERLEKFFPIGKAAEIYSYALILCANGFLHIEWELHNINTKDLVLFNKLSYTLDTLYEVKNYR